MANAHTYTAATAVFTATDNWDQGEVLVIGGKTYTFNTTVGTTDGSVHVGAGEEEDLQNLCAAVNLDPTAGSTGVADADYASGMTENPDVVCTGLTATTITFTAKTPGTVGNFIPTTDTHGEGTWAGGAVVMENGVGDLESWLLSELELNQLSSEVISDLRSLVARDQSA